MTNILLVFEMVGLVATINELDLQKHLMANYNTSIVPNHNSKPVIVKIEICVEALLSVDEANEVINTRLTIVSSWRDKYLTWQPSNFGNVSQTMLKLKQIWLPDIVLFNSVTEFELLGFENMKVSVNSDGKVSWMTGVTARTSCAIDTRLFPFDEQTCNIDIYPWGSTTNYVRFEVDRSETSPFTYENGQWEITSTSFRLMEFDGQSMISCGLNLKRRPMYYISSLIIPMMLISVLNCLSFIIPKQSGERVGYSITVFLAFILMLTLITGTLPRTSTHISVLVVYLGTSLLISFMTITASIISLAIESRISGNGKDFEMVDDKTATATVKETAEISKHNAKNHSGRVEEGSGNLKEPSIRIANTNKGNKKRNCRFNFWLCKLAGFFDYAAFFVVGASTVVSSIVTYVILVKTR